MINNDALTMKTIGIIILLTIITGKIMIIITLTIKK